MQLPDTGDIESPLDFEPWSPPSFDIPGGEDALIGDIDPKELRGKLSFVQARQVENFCLTFDGGIDSITKISLQEMRAMVASLARVLDLIVLEPQTKRDGGDYILLTHILSSMRLFHLQGAELSVDNLVASLPGIDRSRIMDVLEKYGLISDDGDMRDVSAAWWRSDRQPKFYV